MWLITILLAILIALLLIVIMDTSMKLALMITTLYNYESKKLFIPAALTVALWAILMIGCFNSINTNLDNNALEIFFTMIFERSLIDEYKPILLKTIFSTFIIGTLLQSLTYYTVNINYQKIGGTVRFSFKRSLGYATKKIFKKDIFDSQNKSDLQNISRGPKKLTFIRAIITSMISVIITILICIGLFMLGQYLSVQVFNII